MSTYTSQEEKVILKDNHEIAFINLENNPNLKFLIIDNLSNLERIEIPIKEELYVSISNCEKLKKIVTSCDYDVYGSYFYLGENLKYLEIISLKNFNTIKIVDQVFDKLEELIITHIKSLICNFNNFPKLNSLVLENVVATNLIVDSEKISFLNISNCLFENIEITIKGNIKYFEFNNNEYKLLKTENPIKVEWLILRNDNNNKIFPYIQLSDEINGNLKFFVNIDNLYDYEYKYFIERNLSKVKIYNRYHKLITLDDIKFSVP